jgi:hypothetical protein
LGIFKLEKEETFVADEKEKAIQNDQEPQQPAGSKKDELSEKELEEASGGGHWIEFPK